jgi:hypothetical protein
MTRSAERARRLLAHGQAHDAVDAPVGRVADQAPAVELRRPQVVLGVDRGAVRSAGERADVGEHAPLAERAAARVERERVDDAAARVGEVHRRAVQAPREGRWA